MKISMGLSIFQMDNRSTIIQFLLEQGENGRIQNHPQSEKSGQLPIFI